MEAMLKSMLNKSAIIVFLQVPQSFMCISLDDTQETPEEWWFNLDMRLLVAE